MMKYAIGRDGETRTLDLTLRITLELLSRDGETRTLDLTLPKRAF